MGSSGITKRGDIDMDNLTNFDTPLARYLINGEDQRPSEYPEENKNLTDVHQALFNTLSDITKYTLGEYIAAGKYKEYNEEIAKLTSKAPSSGKPQPNPVVRGKDIMITYNTRSVIPQQLWHWVSKNVHNFLSKYQKYKDLTAKVVAAIKKMFKSEHPTSKISETPRIIIPVLS